jgi:hypothetical protein
LKNKSFTLKIKVDMNTTEQTTTTAAIDGNTMLADSLPVAEMCSFVEWIVKNDEWQYSSKVELWVQDGWRSRTTLELYELYKRQISR